MFPGAYVDGRMSRATRSSFSLAISNLIGTPTVARMNIDTSMSLAGYRAVLLLCAVLFRVSTALTRSVVALGQTDTWHVTAPW